jgi:energy-coupling factor transport system permease protein
MLKDISLGKYIDTGSPLHKTDPRVKIVMYIVYLVVLFMIKSPEALVAAAVVTLAQVVVAKISPKVVWTSVLPVLPLALFIFVLNIIASKEGDVIFKWWKITVTNEGLKLGSIMGLRLIFLIISTSVLLTFTTTPLKISDALESLFKWLKIFKIPVHEMAMMMSIALRFIPTLIEETDKIMKAQISRGADYDTGSAINRVKGYVTVLIPLFVASFKHAEELAVAMDARCYRGGEGRTKLNPLKMTGKDWAAGGILLAGAALILVIEFVIH